MPLKLKCGFESALCCSGSVYTEFQWKSFFFYANTSLKKPLENRFEHVGAIRVCEIPTLIHSTLILTDMYIFKKTLPIDFTQKCKNLLESSQINMCQKSFCPGKDTIIISTNQQVSLCQAKLIIKAALPNQQLHPWIQTTCLPALLLSPFQAKKNDLLLSENVTGGSASDLRLAPVAQECRSLVHSCRCWVNDGALRWKTTWNNWPQEHPGLTRSRVSCCSQLLSGCHLFMEEFIPVCSPTLPYYYCPTTTQLDTKPRCVQ